QYFLNRAEDEGKEVIGLETVEDQLSIFANLSPEMQEKRLKESLIDIEEYEEHMEEVLSLYMEGDAEELLDYLVMDKEQATDEEIAFMKALNDDRNHGMAEQIAGFLEEDSGDTYFVIVGALHLIKEPHIRSLLEEKGYEIESIL